MLWFYWHFRMLVVHIQGQFSRSFKLIRGKKCFRHTLIPIFVQSNSTSKVPLHDQNISSSKSKKVVSDILYKIEFTIGIETKGKIHNCSYGVFWNRRILISITQTRCQKIQEQFRLKLIFLTYVGPMKTSKCKWCYQMLVSRFFIVSGWSLSQAQDLIYIINITDRLSHVTAESISRGSYIITIIVLVKSTYLFRMTTFNTKRSARQLKWYQVEACQLRLVQMKCRDVWSKIWP